MRASSSASFPYSAPSPMFMSTIDIIFSSRAKTSGAEVSSLPVRLRISDRMSRGVVPCREIPAMWKVSGIIPASTRWKSAGSSFRWARSPVMPKMTSIVFASFSISVPLCFFAYRLFIAWSLPISPKCCQPPGGASASRTGLTNATASALPPTLIEQPCSGPGMPPPVPTSR